MMGCGLEQMYIPPWNFKKKKKKKMKGYWGDLVYGEIFSSYNECLTRMTSHKEVPVLLQVLVEIMFCILGSLS